MWPWEHLAFGYVLWSGYVHLRRRRGARADEALAVALGTQCPDLIDQPLAWTFDVLPSGISLAHSLTLALPATVAALALGRWTDRRGAAAAFIVAYASHLIGDAIYPFVWGHRFSLSFLFWPLVPTGSPTTRGFLSNFLYYLDSFLASLATPTGAFYIAAEGALLGAALALWLSDDMPGLRVLLTLLLGGDEDDDGSSDDVR